VNTLYVIAHIVTIATTRSAPMEPTDIQDRIDDTEAADTVDGDGAGLVEEELLVEEISIDGMCGVY
jgi:mycofactocin precursor